MLLNSDKQLNLKIFQLNFLSSANFQLNLSYVLFCIYDHYSNLPLKKKEKEKKNNSNLNELIIGKNNKFIVSNHTN
jgi:hypothetical protein